jgi:hypothetical protein
VAKSGATFGGGTTNQQVAFQIIDDMLNLSGFLKSGERMW